MPKQSTPAASLSLKPSKTAGAVVGILAARRVPFLWGAPGIGKSQIVRQVAESLGMALVDIRAVLLDPVDLRGLPTVTAEGTTRWAPPAFLPQEGCGPTLVFLDELNRAPAMVQNACLQLILDRRLGEYVAPDNVRFIAAGNRESDGGGVTRMNPALSGRFQHINVEPDLDDWSRWAVQTGIDPMVIAFLRYRPNLLNDFQKDARSWPNPRSWEFVSDIAAQPMDKEIERAVVAGTVGEGAAIEYMSFVDLYRNLPSIDSILLNPQGAPVPEDVATLYAASSALATRSTADNFGRVLAYLDRLPQEFAVFAVRDATTRLPTLATTPDFTRWAALHANLL